MTTWTKIKLDPYLSLFRKLTSKWIKDLNLKPVALDIMQLLWYYFLSSLTVWCHGLQLTDPALSLKFHTERLRNKKWKLCGVSEVLSECALNNAIVRSMNLTSDLWEDCSLPTKVSLKDMGKSSSGILVWILIVH